MDSYLQMKRALLKKYEMLSVIWVWLNAKWEKGTEEEKEHVNTCLAMLHTAKKKTMNKLVHIAKNLEQMKWCHEHPPPPYDPKYLTQPLNDNK